MHATRASVGVLLTAALALLLPTTRARAEQPAAGDRRVESRPACRSVAHIGDSLTAEARASLSRAYRAAGVVAEIDAFAGRATLQKLRGDARTGLEAARALRRAGFSGCWVVALGTNDTANVAAGAGYTRAHAVDAMMKAIDPNARAPVLWVNAFTQRSRGHWSNTHMREWNEALLEAGARWPNLVVFDWAALAATGFAPFSDGIHHTPAGYLFRNRAIAMAIAELPGR